ncbi:two-component system, OmpR family, sensor histidine kinase VicK [Peptoniphilus asaccharolyticus DSM 20463]|uniref:histidine kinase n=1 Tax=Peptoniphilus asaccharolyticus DSM 20463 TaxID=573058 RepID=A0A1W1V1U7_PEPAS|nr:ATP-binding protein [Peptoniphilus asaccharolyticus]MBL7576028.1 HAMP domain-containing protein [Peptoniphilus asaccharolyticus]SMB87295.1 two-component system, OmpR family, sensor histidine kinase VicK [Peptoniphilus asaccharolyticus DSM 20463]
MLSSIKYRFMTIYFLLVLVCMSIVGAFIINRLESAQLQNVTENMNSTMNSIVTTSSYLTSEDWLSNQDQIINTFISWRFPSNQSMYALTADENPLIIAASKNVNLIPLAIANDTIEPDLVLNSISGSESQRVIFDENSNLHEKHISKPIFSSQGKVMGVLYMTENLNGIYDVIDNARSILTYATGIGLIITLTLGYFLANSITGPIRDLTKKAKLMARGDFNQKVEIKSNDEIGNLGSMFNYLTEELNATMEQMEIEKGKLNTIFTYMQEGVIAVDKNGFLIHANPTAKRILNLKTNTGENLDLESFNISNLDYNDYSSLVGDGEIEIEDRFYKLKYAPFRREKINQGIIVVFQDMTKEHNLDIMRKEFVANVSHELKTPITTIKSYSETILDSEMTYEDIKHFVGTINRESNRMGRLVSDLLQLSNIDYGTNNFVFEPIDTYDIISQTLESLNIMIKEKSHNILLDIPMDIKDLYADMHSTEQIIMNIISNAIKYTAPKGKIEIHCRNIGEYVELKVKDNGIGIPEADLKRIFERFYRVEKGRSRAMGGTGLGLSIAKELTENMGGSIRVNSKYNHGTEVILTFKGVSHE